MPWTEEPGGWATVYGVMKESDTTEHECNLRLFKPASSSVFPFPVRLPLNPSHTRYCLCNLTKVEL